jgi:autotransporter-associated beta strand protein
MNRTRRLRFAPLEDRVAPAILTWDGGGADNRWSTGANWVDAEPPIPGRNDTLIFPDGAAQKANVNDFPPDSLFTLIDLRGPGYQIGGNTLVLDTGITAQYPTPVDPANFPQLNLALHITRGSVRLAGTANFAVVLNGPVITTNSGGVTVTGRCIVNGVVSGNGGIGASGDGADLVLTGNNTNSGGTGVTGGSLRIDGALNPQSSVQAISFAVNPVFLRGSGSVGPAFISTRAILDPGAAGPGTFHVTTLALSGGTYSVDITGGAAGEYDQVAASLNASLMSGTLRLNVSGTPIAPGTHLRIIDVAGANPVFGTFDALPEGATVAIVNGVRFRISYVGGDGNDVDLVTSVGPPTFTWDGGSAASNRWSDAANWAGHVAPVAGAVLNFPVGAFQLSNINDFPAGTSFESLVVGHGFTLGGNTLALVNGVSVAPLAPTGNSATINLGMTLAAAQSFTTPTNFDLNLGGTVDLNGFVLTVSGSGTLNLAGPVVGAGGLVKISSGTLSLSGDNTFTGVTEIRSGFLEVRSNNALGATGSGNDTLFANGGTMTMSGTNLVVPEGFRLGTNFGPTVLVGTLTTGPVTLSGPLTGNGSTTITGLLASPVIIAGSLTGSASLLVTNVIVAATSVSPAFTGSIGGAALEFDGQAPAATASGNLTGTGTLGSVVASSAGTLRPGINGIGTLHTHGVSVSPGNGGIIPVPPGHLAINVSAAGAAQVAVVGTVSLGGVLDLTVSPGFVPAAGTRYRIIDNDGTDPIMTRFFAGLVEGAVAATSGSAAVRITYVGGDGNDVELVAGAAPGVQRVAVGAGAGGFPIVNVYDGNGSLIRSFMAYETSFHGGVNVATADINNDGVPDVITAPGFGGGPLVRIWDGQTGAMLRQFNAYDPAFRGGVNVSTGQENADIIPDIVTGAGRGGGPHVKAFDANGNLLVSFFAYDASFTGGVSVAGGPRLIVTGPGPGGGPHVKVFDGVTGLASSPGFFAYEASFTGGINVAFDSYTGTVLTAPKTGGGPLIRAFFTAGIPAFQFLAYAASFTGGVSLAVLPIGAGGANAIVTGPGPGGGPHVRVWSENGATIQREFLAFDAAFIGGVYIG